MDMLVPVKAVMQTDTGQVRDHNEDYVIRYEPADTQEEEANGWLYIVADGVGGADAGEVASEFASQQAVQHYIVDGGGNDFGARLVQAMQAANTDLRQLVADRDENKRMATTMVAAVVLKDQAYIANVGDSRGYLWRDNRINQITKDQSLVAKLVEEGAITEAEAAKHPHRNVILYSIGSEKKPPIDLFEVSLVAGDKLFLCSDGLTRHVDDEEINEILGQADPTTAASQLINLANERGGQDNISVAIITYGESEQDDHGNQIIRIAMPVDGKAVTMNHGFLIPFTIALSIVMAVLIWITWLYIRFFYQL